MGGASARLRQFSLDGRGIDFVDVARRCQWATMRLDALPLIERDLSVAGRPLARTPEPAWRVCLSIASERHRAAEWLLGQHETWSDVTTST